MKKSKVRIGKKSYILRSDDTYLKSVGRRFEPAMVHLFERLVRPDDHVFDVGANIGCTAILFGQLSKYVYAFEPSPTTFDFLDRNVSGSGLNNIRLFNLALGAKNEETTLTRAAQNRSGAFISNRTRVDAGHITERVIVRTLDGTIDSFALPKPDFVKIDVEGFEKFVLEGAAESLRTARPVVVLELNHWCLNAFQRICVPDFFDFLRGVFPILLAIGKASYADLYVQDQAYHVMHEHMVKFRYPNLVGAFDRARLGGLFDSYRALGVDPH